MFGFFKFLASLKKLSTIHEVCLFFFRLSCAERNISQGRWRPRGNALSMARQPNVGRACGWLVSAVFWSWVEKKLWFPWPFSKRKMKCACTLGSRAPATFSESLGYRAHALSSVVKSSLRQLDMQRKQDQQNLSRVICVQHEAIPFLFSFCALKFRFRKRLNALGDSRSWMITTFLHEVHKLQQNYQFFQITFLSSLPFLPRLRWFRTMSPRKFPFWNLRGDQTSSG